jgi:hypothetical protein
MWRGMLPALPPPKPLRALQITNHGNNLTRVKIHKYTISDDSLDLPQALHQSEYIFI